MYSIVGEPVCCKEPTAESLGEQRHFDYGVILSFPPLPSPLPSLFTISQKGAADACMLASGWYTYK